MKGDYWRLGEMAHERLRGASARQLAGLADREMPKLGIRKKAQATKSSLGAQAKLLILDMETNWNFEMTAM